MAAKLIWETGRLYENEDLLVTAQDVSRALLYSAEAQLSDQLT